MRQIEVDVQGIERGGSSNYNTLLDVMNDIFSAQFVHINELESLKIGPLETNGNVATVVNGFLSAYLTRRFIALARQVRVEKMLGMHKSYESEHKCLADKIKTKLNVNDENLSSISSVLIKLIHEVPGNKIKKNKKHGKELALYAVQNDLKCYICGSEIDYSDKEGEFSLQLEHHIPRTHGGSKASDNIFVSCKRCNDAKGNFLNWQETGFNLLHKHLVNIEKVDNGTPESVDDPVLLSRLLKIHLDGKMIFIVSCLCNFSCYQCGKHNDDAGECYILPKEIDDYFHPLNLMVLCETCKEDVERSFWDAGQLIPIVRISNVRN